jgi:copper(I)-binding protein
VSLSRGAVALALAALAAPAAAVDIQLRNAWARPMAKGYPVARVYVDIRSDTALKLVGAASPASRSVALVSAGIKADGRDEKPVEVTEIEVGRETRLALHGDYLELREVLDDKMTGATIPLRLEFVDGDGSHYAAETTAVVRGIALQPPPEPAGRRAQPKAPAGPTAKAAQ